MLVGLYFAVEDEAAWDEDGKLFALNASRMNYVTRLHDPDTRYICGASSIDVVVRAEMAKARRKKDLRYAFAKTGALDLIESINRGNNEEWHRSGIYFLKQWLEGGGLNNDDRSTLLKLLRAPVAVFPNRMNPRMTSQLAMALVFGGKIVPQELSNAADKNTEVLPKPSDKGVASDPCGLCLLGAWAETSLARSRRHHGWKYTISSMLTRPLANPNRIAGVCLSAPTST